MSPPTRSGDTALAEWKRGWPVVVTGAIGYGTGLALFNVTAGLFIEPMREDFGWSVRALSLAPFAGIVMALCNPFVGMLVDKVGARPSLLFGQLGFALSLVALALMPPDPVAIYAIVIILGAISPLTNIAPIARGIASWFRKSAGMAIGTTLNGISVVAIFAVPLVSFIIADHGWRAGYFTLAGLIFCLGFPLTFFGFREKESRGDSSQAEHMATGIGAKEAFRDARFWGLLMVLIISAVPLGGFLTHLVPILLSSGFDQMQATWLATLFPFSMMVGRIGGGFLLDRLKPEFVAAFLLTTAWIGAASLYQLDASPLFTIAVPAVLLLGMAQGAESDYVAFFTLRFFGLKAYSTIVGTYAMAIGLSMSVGGLGFSELYDRQGGYEMSILLGAGGFLLAAFAMLALWLFARKNKTDAY
ncbi:MAG: MFS transporter [Sphingomonadaceae bacterium]